MNSDQQLHFSDYQYSE